MGSKLFNSIIIQVSVSPFHRGAKTPIPSARLGNIPQVLSSGLRTTENAVLRELVSWVPQLIVGTAAVLMCK